MTYPCNGILFSIKEDLTTDKHNDTDELQKHAKKPHAKTTVYDSIYMKYPEKARL